VFPSDKEVYEVHSATPHIVSGYGPDGTDAAEFLESVFECENEIEAKQFAAQFATDWELPMNLYRVPAINTTDKLSLDLWPNEMKFIVQIEPMG
jgi:hypothetical protein